MTNTKITRSINFATASCTYVNMDIMELETKDVTLPTTKNLSSKDFEKAFNSRYPSCKLVKVGEIKYSSVLYEMSIDDFIRYGTGVSSGRSTLDGTTPVRNRK